MSLYGHPRMYVLQGAIGFLCHRLWAAPERANLVLFSDPKTAKAWLAKARKQGAELEVTLQSVTTPPDNMGVTINPGDDNVSINIILKQSFFWQTDSCYFVELLLL